MVCDLCRRKHRLADSCLCEVCREAILRLAEAFQAIRCRQHARRHSAKLISDLLISGFSEIASEYEFCLAVEDRYQASSGNSTDGL